jgi:uncharacterized oxidoreductase
MKITGNTILVTGGTSGIGQALAEALHAKGNKVIIAGRRQERLDAITKANPGMEGMRLDVTDTAAVTAFANTVKERFPQLNVLINNAGIARMEKYSADTVDFASALEVVQTNISSVLQLTAELLPLLRSQPAATLMVTTSGLAFVPFAPAPTYSATKAFLHNWLVALRAQLGQGSLEILELAPPYVQTEFGGPQQAIDPRAMPLADYTREVMQILEENRIERGEVLVENVKPLRWAEKTGTYDQMVEMFNHF